MSDAQFAAARRELQEWTEKIRILKAKREALQEKRPSEDQIICLEAELNVLKSKCDDLREDIRELQDQISSDPWGLKNFFDSKVMETCQARQFSEEHINPQLKKMKKFVADMKDFTKPRFSTLKGSGNIIGKVDVHSQTDTNSSDDDVSNLDPESMEILNHIIALQMACSEMDAEMSRRKSESQADIQVKTKIAIELARNNQEQEDDSLSQLSDIEKEIKQGIKQEPGIKKESGLVKREANGSTSYNIDFVDLDSDWLWVSYNSQVDGLCAKEVQ